VLLPYKKWVLETGKEYEIYIEIYDTDSHKIYPSDVSAASIIFIFLVKSAYFDVYAPIGRLLMGGEGGGGRQAPSSLVTKLTRSFPSSIIYPSILLAPSPVFASPLNPPYVPAAFPLSCPSASHWPFYFPPFHLHLSPHSNRVGVG
jgi:hypothetical protein